MGKQRDIAQRPQAGFVSHPPMFKVEVLSNEKANLAILASEKLFGQHAGKVP